MSMITVNKYSRIGCRPCAVLSHYLGEINLAAHNAELVEIDTATLSDAELDRLNITSVPVLQFMRNGMEISRIVGLCSPEEIEDSIKLAKVAP